MEPRDDQAEASYTFGDRSSSDIVVRLRNEEGRDDWIYCHSKILTEKSGYFADRLSDKWPTCKILDSRYCVEVICQESDYDHHVNLLRLLYSVSDGHVTEDNLCHNVKSTLGILCVAKELSCPQIITACVNYLEAVPWEEGEEEEILRIIPGIGLEAEPVLARLQPVDESAVIGIFLSAFRFATSSQGLPLSDIKSSAQEQIEYMITEDDDAPLLIADEEIKLEVKECIKSLFGRFFQCLEAKPVDSVGISKNGSFKTVLSDLSWAFQILTKMEVVRDFVITWVDTSEKLVKLVEAETVEIRVKVIEVTAKVVEAIGYGTVILPTTRRLQMVKLWLPFVRNTKPLVDSAVTDNADEEKEDEAGVKLKIDGEIWQALESSFVSIILALPSSDQAEILTDWLSKNGSYPDLTEAFEVWCYRSKVAKRRLGLVGGEEEENGMT